ncbi:MAG: response regulator transcription factor [Chloroflexota bacterium]|nr:response regulator transcription factor [Chloroflexota bacterium]
MIRIVLCDDQEIVTEGLQLILSTVAGVKVVGIAHDGAEAVDLVAHLKPDVVLMDLKMPIMNGIQATRQICERFPATHGLVLTTYDADEWVFDAIRAGAAGYLLKDTPRAELITAIKGTATGTTHIDPNVAGKLFSHIAQPGPANRPPTTVAADLSERERDVLRLLANGLSNGDIADRLHLSKGTVQNYVSNILVKLEVTDRTGAAVVALRYGLVD